MDYEEFAEKYFDYNTNEFVAPEDTKVIVPFSLVLQNVDTYRLDSFMRHAEIVVKKK